MSSLKLNDSLKLGLGIADLWRNEKPRMLYALNRYRRVLHHCNIILSRIDEESLLVKSFIHDIGIKKSPEIQPESYWQTVSKLNLDIESYFIFARILLDRVTAVVGHILPDQPAKARRSFHKHRNYFIKGNSTDKVYGDFVKQKTRWFDVMLKSFRDYLIVHDEITTMSYQGTSPNELPTISKMVSLRDKEFTDCIMQLNVLCNNHISDIPEGMRELNIWQRLQILDKNTDKLNQEEIQLLVKLHQKRGGTFPQISELNKKIQEYLDFIGSHFSQFQKS